MNPPAILGLSVVKLFNRVLSDFSAASAQLSAHAGKVIVMHIGPICTQYRIGVSGYFEPVGVSSNQLTESANLILKIPLPIWIRLVSQDMSALHVISFAGDSELAADLFSLMTQIEWDIEEDLSRTIGVVAAHRTINTIQRLNRWCLSAHDRIHNNIAEYIYEELGTALGLGELEQLIFANETMRDDIARLEARLNKLNQFRLLVLPQ